MEGEGEGMVKGSASGEGAGNNGMKVLVAVDSSEESLQALSWTIDSLIARTGGGGVVTREEEAAEDVVLLHVLQHFSSHFVVPVGPGSVYATPAAMESLRKVHLEKAEILLNQAEQICKDKNVRAKTVLLEGEPKETICHTAEKMNIDLLVVGSRGLGKIKRAVLGSVSDYCAHHAKCPVLIVKPHK